MGIALLPTIIVKGLIELQQISALTLSHWGLGWTRLILVNWLIFALLLAAGLEN